MRRILLDQGLSPAAASLLCSDGWDALHVIDAGLDRADDIQILEFARRNNRACVTLDMTLMLTLLWRRRPDLRWFLSGSKG
jgi:predicted nuclease of predicted toxin-antitoxin system